MGIYEELQWRGLIKDVSDPAIKDKINAGGLTFYIGTDPTGDSLHIGHFSSFLICKRLKDAGHNPIMLVGGATGLIGDPKPDSERPMITKETVEHNFNCLKGQLTKLFGCEVVNNCDWCKDINFIDFLRDFGKFFNVNYMLNKDIVARRLDAGITYTEFSYMILQALDFLHLYETKNVVMQVAGQDQWGNITAGVDLIRRKLGGTTELNKEHEAFGLTFPLVTRSDGKKMGKTEKGAIFLDPEMTSVYDFFQYWRNVVDADVRKFFLLFTFLPVAEIDSICNGNINEAKERLAYEVTMLIHGKDEADKALAGAKAAFSGQGDKSQMPTAEVDKSLVENGVGVIDFFAAANIGGSKSEIRRLIQQGGAAVNGNVVADVKQVITLNDADETGEFILRAGKKKFVRVVLK